MANLIRLAVAAAVLTAAAQGVLAANKDQSRLLPEMELAQTATGTGTGTTADPAAPPVVPLPGQSGTSGDQSGMGGDQSGMGGDQSGTSGDDQSGMSGMDGDQSGADGDQNVTPDLSQPNDGEDMSLGEIPDIVTVELTPDMAKKAIDVYTLVKTKYANTDLEQYDNLQDFVDQNAKGKEFEADIKAAGFANVTDWNTAITTLGFAYSGLTNDPTADINQQISEIQADTKIAQDMKDRMIKSLKAMIPSENNKKVAQELEKDPAYAEKLKQLDSEEE